MHLVAKAMNVCTLDINNNLLGLHTAKGSVHTYVHAYIYTYMACYTVVSEHLKGGSLCWIMPRYVVELEATLG